MMEKASGLYMNFTMHFLLGDESHRIVCFGYPLGLEE
jgi:hypothetical protein